MAHYAFLDENNIVVEVIVGKDEDEDGGDWERRYTEIRGQVCKRTSYNTYSNQHIYGGAPFRKNYAGIGYEYNSELDAFIPPRPFLSWIFNAETCNWEPPFPYPDDGNSYIWNDDQGNWVLDWQST